MAQLCFLLAALAIALVMFLMSGLKPKQALVCVLAMFMALPAYGWGGDGFLLPFRGQRVARRCAEGRNVFNGPRRHAAVAKMQSGGYGHWANSHSSGGSSGTYGSATHGNIVLPPGDGEIIELIDSEGNVTYGRIVDESPSSSSEPCEGDECIKRTSREANDDQAIDAFKNSLTSARRDPFREQLNLARRMERPTVLLAAN